MEERAGGDYVRFNDVEPALNLLNRLDEMGVSDAVAEIKKLREESKR